MQNEYRPFYEIEFDFTTSLSKESAVLAMLGWIGKPFREITESEYDYQYRVDCDHPITEEESLIFEPHNPSLFEILREVKNSADSEYVEAKYEEPLDENTIAEKLANIKKSHELIETAYKFYCSIDDELAKGEQSQLRIDLQATTDSKNPHITVMSLAKWAKNEFKIDLFPSIDPVTFKDLNLTQQEILESLESDSGAVDTTNLQITFALLVEAFSRIASKFRDNDGKPNASAIATEICLRIGKTEVFIGLSKRNVEGYISSGLRAKKGHETKLQKNIKTKTLQVCLALLADAFASRRNDFQNTASNLDAAKIAEHLALHANELLEQDQKLIETRLLQAIEVRKNPDRRKS